MDKPTAVVMFSGGITSWAAGKRYVEQHGANGVALLFSDTLVEDGDNYRFIVESAANLTGVPAPGYALDIPPIWHPQQRKAYLMDLAAQAMRDIPALHWIADGRTPWEVMRDEKIIGNSKYDPCSKILKRKLLDRWRNKHCDPATTNIILGIGWDEQHRIERIRLRIKKWTYLAPLCDKPWISKPMCLEWATREGLTPPRSYSIGASHSNCFGFCVKAGQASFALLLKHFPEAYAWNEAQEEAMREIVGDHSIMKDRRGGTVKRLTMRQLRERIEAKQGYDETDLGGCGCALPINL